MALVVKLKRSIKVYAIVVALIRNLKNEVFMLGR